MSRYFNYTEDDYVAHFGIKGMKWGIRRYQKSNGSLTPSGKSRYNKKSDHQLKLEAKYQKKGKSKEEAEAAAKKRIKIGKAIAIGAGITLGTAATVALIKKYKGHSDNIIAEVKDKPMDNWVKIADTATDKFQQKVKPESFKPETFKPAGFTPNGFKPEGFDFDTFKPKGATYSSATGANWTDLLHKAEIKNPGLINDIEDILKNEDIIKNADAKTIQSNISRLSTKELNEATLRANMKRQLGDISNAEKTRGRRAAMEVIRDFATITAAASGAIALGYRMRKVHKDFFDKNPDLPVPSK